MALVQTSVFNVLKRFPDRKEQVMRLFRERDAFRGICEDYEQCIRSLRYWSSSTSAEAPARREEYAAMLQDLEEEIGQHLEET